jgi:hypothetical protein
MPKEDGHKNLKPIRSEEEARIKGKKGGTASGKARLAKKTAREYAIAALEGVTKDKEGKSITIKDVMIQKLIAKAVSEADLNAIKYIVELIGESPSQKIEVTGKDGKDLLQKDLSKDEAKALIAEMSAEFGWNKK